MGRGTSGTAALPSAPVVASCFFPSLSTIVTVAPSTLLPLSVTVTATGAASNSAVTVTSAAGIVKVLTFDEPATGTIAPPFVWLTFSRFSR